LFVYSYYMKKLYCSFILAIALQAVSAQSSDTLPKQSTDSVTRPAPAIISPPAVVASPSALKQTATAIVRGIVTDEKDNSPMIGVNVSVKGTTNGISTDDKGSYELRIPLGTYTLDYTYIGYQERIQVVTATKEDELHTFNVKMTDLSKELEIVVVSGSKVDKTLGEQPQSMEVLKGQNITNSAQGLQEAMNKVPGVNMIGKTISIRGGSGFSDQTSNRTLVLLDEVPVVSPENGSIRWATMPTEAIEQMEITKGSSTVLYGSQALNGSVDIKTMVPQKDSVVNKFFANYGDYFRFADHTWTWFYKKINNVAVPPMYGSLAYLYERKFRDVDVVYNGAFQDNQGYTSYNADMLVRNYIKLRYIPHKMPSLNIGGSVNFAYEKYDDFFLYKNYNDTSRSYGHVPTYDTQVLEPGDSNLVKLYTLNINPYITYYGKNGTRYNLKTAYYFVESNNTSGDSGRYHKLYIEPNITRKFKKADVDVTAGLRYSYRKTNSHTYANKYAHYAAAYGQVEKRFDKRFTIRAGLSLEFNKLDTISSKNDLNFVSALAGKDSAHQYYSPVKPVVNVGLNYKVTEGTFLRGSFCQGYRFPDIAEAYVLTPESGALAVPNPHLKPESGWNAEVGIKQGMKLSRWVFYADLAGYLSRYTNLIEFVDIPGYPGPGPNPYPNQYIFEQAQNVSHAQIWGVEVSAIGTGSIFGVPLNFLLGYNYMDPRNLDYNPNDRSGDVNSTPYLYYRMKHSAKADIQTTYKRIIIGFTAVYIGHLQQIDPLIQSLSSIQSWLNAHGGSGDVVLDARVGYSKNRLTATLIGKNLANRAYTLRPGFVEAPASLTFQVTYQLGRVFPLNKKKENG
jgi:outer membrane receptor protein involved in Fe transport